jgi:serine/threonine-protein kinase
MLKRKTAAGKGQEPAASQFGRYRVLSPLGQGAMASVYLAEDPSLNRLVAVKVIHSHLASIDNLLTRFTAEAKTAASLRNPNIVEIFDYGLQDGQQYLVMEYIDGPNLQFVLNLLDGKFMEAEACAAVICQAAEGLMSAEKNGVVHRDIKPENMMFTSDGALKIADFGIAHINEQNLTQTGSILGSPSFMSPEQIDGGKPSHQTDMFSLGAVLYYCLTGRKPFSGSNIPTLMRSICDLPHPPVLDLRADADPALVTLVDTLLRKKPEDRGNGARWLALQLRT